MRGSRKDFDDSGVRFREEDRGVSEFMRQLRAMFSQDDKEESNLDKLLRYAGVNPDDQTMDPNDLFERYLPKEDRIKQRAKERAARIAMDQEIPDMQDTPREDVPKQSKLNIVKARKRLNKPPSANLGGKEAPDEDPGLLSILKREQRRDTMTASDTFPENLDPYARPPIFEEAGFVEALKATPLDETNRTMSAGDEDIDFDFGATQKDMAKSLGYKVEENEGERYKYFGESGSFLGDLSRSLGFKYDTRPDLVFGDPISENKEGGLIPKRRKKNKMRFSKGGGAIGCGIAVRGNRNLNRDITKKTNI
jgi:hypothetical protein